MTTPALELIDVSKTYGSGDAQVQALKHASIKVQPGEFAVLLGPSGSGKSTFLTIAGNLNTPSSGTVKIAGQDVSSLTSGQRDQLRLEKIGFVLQAHNLVPYLTVLEQFELVRKVRPQGNLSRDELDALLQRLGVAHLANSLPGNISGGQQQRVAIARALYTRPALVLADEPTAALDSESVQRVAELFKEIATTQKTAIVTVTHDRRLVPLSDAVYEMQDGVLSRMH